MANVTDPNSGLAFTNTQRYLNETADSDGTTGEGDATRKVYSSNNVVANGDNRKVAIGKLDAEFDPTTGHNHDGANSAQVSAADLLDLNYFKAVYQTFSVSPGVGLDDDITTQMSGKTPGGNDTTAGVITTAPYNKVEIRDLSLETYIEDSNGQRVYGRITESSGTWTLTYYTNEAGVETAHSLTSTNIRVYFREVFTLETVPTIPDDAGFIGSLDLTADVVDASTTQRGVVSTGAQSFGGLKTLADGLILEDHFATPKLDVASAGTPFNALTYNPFIKFTGVTAVTVNGIASGTDGKRVVIHNGTSQDLTLSHESGSASAADRLKLPAGNNLTVSPDSSTELIYDSSQSRWVIKSGSGSGGGFNASTDTFTLVDNTGSPTAIDSRSATTFKGLLILYTLTRAAGQAKTGQFFVSSDGTSAQYADSGAELGTTGVTFTADVSGGNIRFLYTTTSTGTNALLRYELKEVPTP